MNSFRTMTRTMAVAAFFTFLCTASRGGEQLIKQGDKIAFLGDSITQLGNSKPVGYVNLVMKGLEVAGIPAEKIPAGISGHKSTQMKGRLQRDVLDKHPQVMTFSCGVNDVWHEKECRNGVETPRFDKFYRMLLDRMFLLMPMVQSLSISSRQVSSHILVRYLTLR